MNGLPLLNENEPPDLPSFSFLDLMNDSNRDLSLGNLTLEDIFNPVDEAQREEYRNLAKRRLPYIENRHLPVTETTYTLAGIHISKRNGLGFLFRMFGGEYWVLSPSFK